MVIKRKVAESKPICPYCEKEIEEIETTKGAWRIPHVYVYMCPHCKKVLSVGGPVG